jgi:hypothetical protein
MSNKDLKLMKTCVKDEVKKLFLKDVKQDFEYPLDNNVVTEINKIINLMREEDSDYEIFKHKEILSSLWKSLIEKSIKCLRLFDTREPFTNKRALNDQDFEVCKNKNPSAYGIDVLFSYYKKNREFENILYGASKYYRDHVVHVFRTWLSGLKCLVDGNYLEKINININKNEIVYLNNCEKLSIWTIIALTHDLGYPLEKAKEIINNTNDMVSTFITNPNISMDLSFHGVQNYMNDFIVRLMSSKMENMKKDESYYARLQPKYYFKFQKSLEKTEHGIVSTLIIYKLLTYFLESDYNINEDYPFNKDERRQFYIRREILRSIASHTCKDVYHLYMCSFAFLLIVTDDTQEWGRKYISELYVESGIEYELHDIDLTTSENKFNKCEISEEFKLLEKHGVISVKSLLRRLHSQALSYIMMFRDGQDTDNRDFTFIKKCKIIYETSEATITLDLVLDINNGEKSNFLGKITYKKSSDLNEIFNGEFFKGLFDKQDEKNSVSWNPEGETDFKLEDHKTWRTGNISFPLIY